MMGPGESRRISTAISKTSGKAINTSTSAGLVKGVLVVQGTDLSKVYYIDNTLDGANTTISTNDVNLVATLVGVTNSLLLANANFI